MKKIEKMKISTVILSIISALFLVGYKTYPGGNTWAVTAADPKIYLKFCANLAVTSNDVDSADALYGQSLTHTVLVNSIISDYNAVTSSYVRLADSATDGTFNATTHANRIINICNGTTGTFDGYAQQSSSGTAITGCTITLGSLSFGAKKMVRTLTHEIGHCLGLDHPQETKWSLMSYFSDSESILRLQNDDKAGLTYLYPTSSSYSRTSTYGASCAAKN